MKKSTFLQNQKKDFKKVKNAPSEDHTAHFYDRDKNLEYHANDEAVEEIFSEDGHLTIKHPNWHLELKNGESHE